VAPGDTTVPPSHEEVLEATNARAVELQTLVAAVVGRADITGLPTPLAAESFAGVKGRA
jgi:hypothetical protein